MPPDPGALRARSVCRRIGFLYGEVFAHDQLNQATHDTVGEVFGVANLTAFAHITRILRAGHVVDARGRDVYFPHLARLALPITFLHGAENRLFVPRGTERTYRTAGSAGRTRVAQAAGGARVRAHGLLHRARGGAKRVYVDPGRIGARPRRRLAAVHRRLSPRYATTGGGR